MTPQGRWAVATAACSVSCGSGVQKHEYVCKDEDTGNILEDHNCDPHPPLTPPPSICHLPPCPPRWEAGPFGPCSASCGGGERVRPVGCVQLHGDSELSVPDSECPAGAAPDAVERCNSHHCPTRWHVSEAGECSAVCGPGEARQLVTCVRPEDGQDVEVDQSFCIKQLRPPDFVPCVVDVCPIGWESKGEEQPPLRPDALARSRQAPVYVWSPVISHCSKSCGNGTLQVWFSCMDHQTRLGVSDLYCDASSKPSPQSESCNTSPCPPVWRSKQGVCSVTCGGGVTNRVLYCAREAEGEEGEEEEVVEDSECSHLPKPAAVVSCNHHSCPARWKVVGTWPCSASCDLGVAQRAVSCVQFVHGAESSVPEENCRSAVKPATTVPCLVQVCTFRWEVKAWSQCSEPCGYGIQSRAVSCMGPSAPEPLSPLLCMHMPKPITIQGCNTGSCDTERPSVSPTLRHPDTRIQQVTAADPTEGVALCQTAPPTAAVPAKSSACGRLLLEPSGTVDLRNATGRCIVSIGRPLDEVIVIEVASASLNCRKKEYVAFFDRLALVRKCEQVAGSELTTRTNVLLVRQNVLSPGNGIVFTYRSHKNTKKSHHQDCDIQLFSPSGTFENPTTSDTNHTCRVLINAPPAVKIRIQATHIGVNSADPQSTYIMIRDMDVLKTNVFTGENLFQWQSSGNMAEVEFHGDYLKYKGTFRAEYSFSRR